MKINTFFKLSEIFETTKEILLSQGSEAFGTVAQWALYSDDPQNLGLDKICYIGEQPRVDKLTDEEIFTDFINENKLKFVCTDEIVQDVVETALNENPDASDRDFLSDLLNFLNG